MASIFIFLMFITSACYVAYVWALEPFCVANLSLPANDAGFYPCKDSKFVDVDDFSSSGYDIPSSTTNNRSQIFTKAFDNQIPGLNTLNISMALFDFAKGDSLPPHFHPHCTEIFVVLRGTILINFNTSSASDIREFTKVVKVGDVFVIPNGVFHVQKNVGDTDAAVIGAFSCQHPEVVIVR